MSARAILTRSTFGGLFCGVMLLTCSPLKLSAQDQSKAIAVDVAPVVSITRDGTISLNDQPVNINRLVAEINRAFPKAPAVYLSAEKSTTWDAMSQVISRLSSGNIQIKLVAR